MSLATLKSKVEQCIKRISEAQKQFDAHIGGGMKKVVCNGTWMRNYAFVVCSNTQEIRLPNMDNLAYRAFQMCTALNNIYAPVATRSGGEAFDRCTALVNVEFPELLTLEVSMFVNCTSLESVSVNKCKEIKDYAFKNCTALRAIHIPKDCTMKVSSFTNCTSLCDITIEEGHTKSLYIYQSTMYTAETLHAIIENFADMTGLTAPTFQIGDTNIAKIDEEHIAMLEAKNWNYL